MNETQRQDRNERMLAECWKSFAFAMRHVIGAMEGDGWRPRIQSAYRSPADQKAAYLAGNSKLLFGFHNITGPNGKPESLAVDVLDDGHPLDPSRAYLISLAHFCDHYRLSTGIGWGLPRTMREEVKVALVAKDVAYKGKIGWDPTHCEPMDMTVAEARAGKRP